MRCDDCKAQPRQPGLNAAATFGCCLRYAATVTRRNARRKIVWASLREVARRRVKRGVLLCVLGPYSKLDRTYVRRVAVADSIPRCKQATLSDFKLRLFDAFKVLIFFDSQGTIVFRCYFWNSAWQTNLIRRYLKIFVKDKRLRNVHVKIESIFCTRRFLLLRKNKKKFISANFQI